jgi:hypothetical protein
MSENQPNLLAYTTGNPVRFVDRDGRAETDTSTVDPQKLTPSNALLNKVVNERIAAARAKFGIRPDVPATDEQRKAFVLEISQLGEPRGGGGLNTARSGWFNDAYYNKTEIERIAARSFPTQAPGPKYWLAEALGQGARAPGRRGRPGAGRALGLVEGLAALGPKGLAAFLVRGAVNPSIVLADKKDRRIPVGTDKLGHFFAQGYQEFERSVLEGKGDAHAELQSFKQEQNEYGLSATGVFSNADREANKLGRIFYQRMYHDPFLVIDIAEYANWNLNEVMNPNTNSRIQEGLLIASGQLPPSDQAENEKRLVKIEKGIAPYMEPVKDMEPLPKAP